MTSWSAEDAVLGYLFCRAHATPGQIKQALAGLSGTDAVVERLSAEGALEPVGTGYRLTTAGKARVPGPARKRPRENATAARWFRERLLPALALGLSDAPRSKAELTAAILAREVGRDGLSLKKAKSALFWHLLGRSDAAEDFTEAAVKRFLLEKHLGTPVRSTGQGLSALVARKTEVPSADLEGGLRRRFLARLRALPADGNASGGAAIRASFARRALDAAARTSRRFGDGAFIIGAHEALDGPPMSLETFKAGLLEAHRAGELTLRRADMTSAMDPATVQASEVRGVAGSSFHLIAIEEARR